MDVLQWLKIISDESPVFTVQNLLMSSGYYYTDWIDRSWEKESESDCKLTKNVLLPALWLPTVYFKHDVLPKMGLKDKANYWSSSFSILQESDEYMVHSF